jgi:hypothetical protein
MGKIITLPLSTEAIQRVKERQSYDRALVLANGLKYQQEFLRRYGARYPLVKNG